VLGELAERLHRHQLAGVRIARGVQVEEVNELLRVLGEDTWRQGRPLGLVLSEGEGPVWDHVALEPLPLDQLALGEEARRAAADRRADQLWRGLAMAVMGVEPEDGQAGPSAEGIASALREGAGDPDRARAVVNWILEADSAAAEAGPDSPVARRLGTLFEALDPQTLARITELGADPPKRRSLAMAAARSIPVGAAVELLRAAADPDHALSHAMLRMLRKLADHADVLAAPVLPGADAALRDSVRQLVTDWTEEERTTASYRHLLELLARTPTEEPAARPIPPALQESLRLTYMGFELGIAPLSVRRAITDVIHRAELPLLLELYQKSRGCGAAGEALHERLTDPEFLTPLVLDESRDESQIGALVDRLGQAAVEPLLEALEMAESSSKRRWLLGRLKPAGPELGPLLVAHLPGKPWYVQRNLLMLLGSIGRMPEGFSALPYARHEDPRVRREAYKVLFADPSSRESAILQAVADPDESIARLGLQAAASGCPAELPGRLLDLARSRYRDPELRALAIRVMAAKRSPAVRDWLVSLVLGRRGWFGRRRLLPKCPESLAALGALRAHWSTHPEAAQALRLAVQSRDPDVRAAARAAGSDG
jgi:hypothetical protein